MSNIVDKVIEVALKEVGYLEKTSNNSLNNKTKNAGSNNYTKYGEWFGMNGVYWCAEFISWIFYKAYDTHEGKAMLCGGYSAACETIRQQFINKKQYHTNNPKIGDVIFFKGSRHLGANHIGIVYKVSANRVYTIEGNSSGGSAVIDNGGGVVKKEYDLNYYSILGYGRPKYDIKVALPTLKRGMEGSEVSVLQENLNKVIDAKLIIDGDYGAKTAKAVMEFKKKYKMDNLDGDVYGKKASEIMAKALK